ncbi:MAG: hypothetical protein OXC62_03030 [Aestuariivita sp.]|nr:hypothetical protein [Aestuariivita sp.]
MSPQVIHAALIDQQFSVLHDPDTKTYYAILSMPSKGAQDIYATVGLELTMCPFEISKSIAKRLLKSLY